MLEYVNKDGYTYTEEEINQFAKDNNTSFDDILEKNGLTPKKQKQTSLPGKEKTVTKKDANVTDTNTASKSAKSSSASRTKLWDANTDIDTNLASKALGIQKLTSPNPVSKEKKQEADRFVSEMQKPISRTSPFVTKEMQKAADTDNEKVKEAKRKKIRGEMALLPSLQDVLENNAQSEDVADPYKRLNQMGQGYRPEMPTEVAGKTYDEYGLPTVSKKDIETTMNRVLSNEEKEQRYKDLLEVTDLEEKYIKENPEYAEAAAIIFKASNLDDNFINSLDADIADQISRNGKMETSYDAPEIAVGGLAPASPKQVTRKFVAFPKQREQLIAQFKKAGKTYTENQLLDLSSKLYKQEKEAAQVYNQKFDAFENIDGYSDKVKYFLKNHDLNKTKVNDYNLAKTKVQADYTQNVLEQQEKSRQSLIDKLKPADYKYTNQEEIDAENNLRLKINNLNTKIKDNFNYLNELYKKSDTIDSSSTSLKKDIELYDKEWGWFARSGRKILNSVVDFTLAGEAGVAWAEDMVMEYLTHGKWNNKIGNIVAGEKNWYKKNFEDDIPEARETNYSIESFGENAANAVITQLPQIITMMVAPEIYSPELVGFVTGTTTGIGSKYTEMLDEQNNGVMNETGEMKKPNYSTTQLFAVPALFGLFEGGSEYVGGRAIGRMQKMFGKATKSEMETLLGSVDKTIGQKAKDISKDLLQNYGEEVPSEVFNTVLGNFTDKTLLDKKDKDLLEGVPETIFDTAVVSTLFATTPHIAGAVYRQFIPATYAKQLVENNNKIAEILKGVDYEKLSPEEKTIIDNKVKGIKDSSTIIINDIAETIGATDTGTLLGIDKLSKNIIDIRKQANIINNSQNLSQEQKDAMLTDMAKEHLDATTEYNRILGNAYRAEQMNKKAASWLNRNKLNKENLRGEKYLATVMAAGKNVKYDALSNKELIDKAIGPGIFKNY